MNAFNTQQMLRRVPRATPQALDMKPPAQVGGASQAEFCVCTHSEKIHRSSLKSQDEVGDVK